MERDTDTPEHPIIIIFFSFKKNLSVVCDYPAQDFTHMKSRKHLLIDLNELTE